MTAEDLWRELGNPQPPTTIWQRPFDYDPKHLHSLCALAAERKTGRLPEYVDLTDYTLDLTYEEIQPDLLVFLLPLCLKAWSMDLLGQTKVYGGFTEQFWNALNRRPGPLDLLSDSHKDAVERYMREAILMAIDDGRRLWSAGKHGACYRSFYNLSSFATVFPGLNKLWSSWWDLSSEGRAVGALQYLSCLMYEQGRNPAFAPWTPTEGGGPPGLWEDAMMVNNNPWDPRNVTFLQSVLIPSELCAAIDRCIERLTHPEDQRIASEMKHDFQRQQTLLELRIEQLLKILSSDHYSIHEWTI